VYKKGSGQTAIMATFSVLEENRKIQNGSKRREKEARNKKT